MNDLSNFEEKIRKTYRVRELEPQFVNRLESKLLAIQPSESSRQSAQSQLRLRWAYAATFVLVIAVAIFAIGPAKVWAQIQQTFGYIPGKGIVSVDAPYRQLAETVSSQQNGITLSVNSAFLSTDKTVVVYEISKLPEEIKGVFGKPVCNQEPYLQLPNDEQLSARYQSMTSTSSIEGETQFELSFNAGIAADVEEASLVFPCLPDAKRGTGPKDWAFKLAFVPADEQTIYAFTLADPEDDGNPTVAPSTTVATEALEDQQSQDPAGMVPSAIGGKALQEMTLFSVLEKPDSYWVSFYYNHETFEGVNHNGMLTLEKGMPLVYEANGKALPEPSWDLYMEMVELSNDLNTQFFKQNPNSAVSPWFVTMPVPKTGVDYPVSIAQTVLTREFPELDAYADLEFNTALLKEDEPLVLNQEITIGKTKLLLVSIELADMGPGGYRFNFDGSASKVNQVEVEILNHPTNIGLSGYGTVEDPFRFSTGGLYFNTPKGKLTLRISLPAVITGEKVYIGHWMPE